VRITADAAERLRGWIKCYALPMPSPRIHTNTVLIRLGAEIKRRRQKLDISQLALAANAGVHVNVVGRTERGKYNPSILTLDAIAAALNTSMVDLLRKV
jgi:DNA-binding XRE family transcriptional regulator